MSEILYIDRRHLPSYIAAEYEVWLAKQSYEKMSAALAYAPVKEKHLHCEPFRASRERYWAAQDIAREAYKREFIQGKRSSAWK